MLTFLICYLFIGGWLASSFMATKEENCGIAKALAKGLVAYLFTPILFLVALVLWSLAEDTHK